MGAIKAKSCHHSYLQFLRAESGSLSRLILSFIAQLVRRYGQTSAGLYQLPA
ncbi:MAG: hypothetical protein WBD36_10960 [Bacteroidota bacterium]